MQNRPKSISEGKQMTLLSTNISSLKSNPRLIYTIDINPQRKKHYKVSNKCVIIEDR